MDPSRFPYLQGNDTPISEEHDFDMHELRVEGLVPRILVGDFIRNGANTAVDYRIFPREQDGRIIN